MHSQVLQKAIFSQSHTNDAFSSRAANNNVSPRPSKKGITAEVISTIAPHAPLSPPTMKKHGKEDVAAMGNANKMVRICNTGCCVC
jgi:hypothetical protein